MRVFLADGREIAIPLEWFPLLRDATPRQRKNWRLIGGGVGLHWKEIDEDISVESLLAPAATIPLRKGPNTRPRRKGRTTRRRATPTKA